jgi:hypothetical protein
MRTAVQRGGTSLALAAALTDDKHLNHAFYRRTMQLLRAAGIPYMIGGAFALDFHVGTNRKTKDLDVFVRPADAQRVLDELARAGYETEMNDPVWLGKAYCGADFVDVIFAFGNGIAVVDDEWFEHAGSGELWGEPVLFVPLEESLWSKAFVMDRDRFDGADIAHIILKSADRLDWARLLRRFGPEWRVLLAHLVLVGYIYPGRRSKIPNWLMCELLRRLESELSVDEAETTCCGTYFSRSQYVHDLEHLGMIDARTVRNHTTKEIEHGNVTV